LGCLIVHETEAASYGWEVVRNSWTEERFHVVADDGSLPAALGFQGWISRSAAQGLAERSGTTLDELHRKAIDPGFRPFPLQARLRGAFLTTDRRVTDVNVVGRLPGTTRADETVVVTAHWDHLGTKADAAPGVDAIFNGAVDNASGSAGLLAVAAALRARPEPLTRSVLFVATTAEEQGLLGSRHFVDHPGLPLDHIVAAANIDSMNVGGRTKNIEVVGAGQSSLEDVLAEVAAIQGRTVMADERPEAGSYYRSDHFPFARKGVPAIYFRGGKDLVQGGRAAGEQRAKEHADHYHQPSDQFDANWSFEGALEDATAMVELLARVADAATRPRWRPDSEFARLRPPAGD
jgi:Zn-dependent M28 family amino/carboxypeptidase